MVARVNRMSIKQMADPVEPQVNILTKKETTTVKFWLGEDDIVRVVVLPFIKTDAADAQENLAVFKYLARGKKLPVLADIREVTFISREARQLYVKDKNVHAYISALALVVSSPISRVIGSLFLGISRLPVLTRLFNSETEALAWLKSHQEE